MASILGPPPNVMGLCGLFCCVEKYFGKCWKLLVCKQGRLHERTPSSQLPSAHLLGPLQSFRNFQKLGNPEEKQQLHVKDLGELQPGGPVPKEEPAGPSERECDPAAVLRSSKSSCRKGPGLVCEGYTSVSKYLRQPKPSSL